MTPFPPMQLFVIALGCLCVPQYARELQAGAAVDASVVEKELLEELSGDGSGDGRGSEHTEDIEETLRPIFAALEKDRLGRVGHGTARYALHRYFMQRYRWFVRGLEPGAADRARKGPASMAQAPKVEFNLTSAPEWPSIFQAKLEEIRGGSGLSMHDIATLAATFEDLVHHESRSRLNMAYDTHNHVNDRVLTRDVMRSIVDDYAVIFMSAWNMTKLTSEEVSRRENIRFRQQYWIRDWVPMLDSLFERFVGSVNKETHDSSFNALTLVGDAIGKEFHRINDKECGEMKATFMSFESRVPGRVRLSDFYNKSTVSKWAFREKIGYLRALGALDETNTSNPMVIFTNYITSMPQCAPVSSFYSVCCPSECEDLMGKIEARIVAPGADPDHVAKVVSGVGSPTVPAPRKLSVSMLNRLHEIAALHGGWVPLHGRLFAQWMHHAFPRECPYPHRAASVSPLTADEWMRETGDADATFSTEEMREHIRPDETCPSTGCNVQETDSLPWDSLEELHQVSSPNSFAEGAVSDISIDQEGSPLIHRDMRLMGPNSNDINRGEAELERLLRDSKRMNVDAEAQESGGFHGAVFRAVLGGLFAASAAVVMRRWSRGHGEQKLPYSVSPEDRFV